MVLGAHDMHHEAHMANNSRKYQVFSNRDEMKRDCQAREFKTEM